MWVADQYLKMGKFKYVITICKQVLGMKKDHLGAHALMAAAHKGLGNEQRFKKEKRFVLKHAPKSPALYLYLAHAYLSLGDSKSAERSYKEGIGTASDRTELRMGLAALHLREGRLKKASRECQEILKKENLAPKHFLNANFALCRIGLKQRNYDEVIKRAGKVVKFYPPIPQGYMYLASAYLGKGEIPKAVEAYKKLMEANPETPVPYQELAIIYMEKLNDYQNAKHCAGEGVRRFPKDAKSQDVLGWLLYQKGEYSEALKQFQEACKLGSKNPYFLYHLGLAYQKTGNNKDAKVAFAKALDLLDPKKLPKFMGELKSRIHLCK
ncbi:MAG: tetratricopeptide repeat protein [Deltaproteobacteria bacterium]|nr:tetratricopeptide repeat protein [Deltaproteobacteria bacterium]